MKSAILGAILLLVACSALAQDENYVVESTIYKGETIIDEPTVSLTSGSTTTLSVENQYNLSILATPGEDGSVYLDINLSANDEIVSPKLLVTPGQPFGAKVGDISIAMVVRNTARINHTKR